MTIRLKFPHIPRIISARIASLSLWGLLISLISLNVLMHQKTPAAYWNNLRRVFASPMSWANHRALADDLWTHGSREAAKHELALAQELYPPDATNVLGATTWEQEPAHTRELIAYWKRIATQYPGYRDAYIQLAALYYSQGNLKSTKSYLDLAQTLDPNGGVVNSLGEFVTKQLE